MNSRSIGLAALVAVCVSAVASPGMANTVRPPPPYRGPIAEPAPPVVAPRPPTPAVPLPLRETRDQARVVYAAVRRGDWVGARRALGRLSGWIANVRAETVGDSADVDALGRLQRSLSGAVNGRDRFATMSAANEITRVATNLSDPFAPLVPTDMDRLDYHGRGLQIAVEQRDVAEVRARVDGLDRTWSRLRRRAFAVDRRDAERLDAAVARLQSVRTRSELARAARATRDALGAAAGLRRAFER